MVQSLITGIDNGVAFSNDNGGAGNTAVWMSDATGSFARITWGSGGTAGLRWYVPDDGHDEIYVKYDVRRHTVDASKQLKILGWGVFNGGGGYSNSTFGPTMGGYTSATYGLYYSDSVSGGDNSVEMDCGGYPTSNLPNINYGGAFSRTPYPTQAVVSTVTQDVSGSVWETYEVFARENSDGSNDGEFAVWKDGVLVFHLTDVWNAGTGLQARGAIGLGEYTPNVGLYEDYRNLCISYDRPPGI